MPIPPRYGEGDREAVEGALHAQRCLLRRTPSTMLPMVPLPVPGRNL
jgi:hypothetical protein